jgi:hypothetical protein
VFVGQYVGVRSGNFLVILRAERKPWSSGSYRRQTDRTQISLKRRRTQKRKLRTVTGLKCNLFTKTTQARGDQPKAQ